MTNIRYTRSPRFLGLNERSELCREETGDGASEASTLCPRERAYAPTRECARRRVSTSTITLYPMLRIGYSFAMNSLFTSFTSVHLCEADMSDEIIMGEVFGRMHKNGE